MTLNDQTPTPDWPGSRSAYGKGRRGRTGSGVGIQELADALGSTLRALRYYEEAGLITPGRDARGRREYGAEARGQGALIVMLRRSGYSVPAIKTILRPDDATGVDVRTRVATALEGRLARLRAEVDAVQSLLGAFGPAASRSGKNL